MHPFFAGYQQGAKSIKPNITVETAYTGVAGDATAWNSPEKAKSAAEVMIANGVDVGYAAEPYQTAADDSAADIVNGEIRNLQHLPLNKGHQK